MGVLTNIFKKQLPVEKPRQSPEYTILRKTEGYEERLYAASTWACSEVTGLYQDTAKIDGFRNLQSYIMGENKAGAQLTMEPPILTRVSSQGCSSFERKFTISTYLSTDTIDKHPRPTTEKVFLEYMPEMTVFVRTFQGLASEERWTYETKKLAENLRNKEDIRTDYYITAMYDSPFQLSSDRNEIWLVKYDRITDTSFTEEDQVTILQVGNLKTPVPSMLSWVMYCVFGYISFVLYIGRTALNAITFIYNNRNGLTHRTHETLTNATSDGHIFSLSTLSRALMSLGLMAWGSSMSVISRLYEISEKVQLNNRIC